MADNAKQPTVSDPAEAVRQLRHANVLFAIPHAPIATKRTMDVIWSYSCDNTMRLYTQVIRPLTSGRLARDAVLVLHLLAQNQAEIDTAAYLRAVPPDSYARAIFDIFESGSKRGTGLTDDEVRSIARRYTGSPDPGFDPTLAVASIVEMNHYFISIGVIATPAAYLNGKSVRITDVVKLVSI